MKKILPLAASLFLRGLHATLRVRHVHVERIENLPQYIIAFWHEHLLLMLHSRYKRPISVLTSQSRDGDLMARVFDYYGVQCSRGSSTRGGSAAVRELIRFGKAGRNLVFTPDGPKGPRRVAKEGVVVAAKATGLPIVPIAFTSKKKSSCIRGTAWWYRCRSHARRSSMESRSTCRVTPTSRSGACASRRR